MATTETEGQRDSRLATEYAKSVRDKIFAEESWRESGMNAGTLFFAGAFSPGEKLREEAMRAMLWLRMRRIQYATAAEAIAERDRRQPRVVYTA